MALCMFAIQASAQEPATATNASDSAPKTKEAATKKSETPAAAPAAAAADDAAAEGEELTNWIELSISGVSLDGNAAAFQRRMGRNDGVAGGIESLRYEKIADDLTFLIEGRAVFGMDDYDVNVSLIKDDVGFVRGGFRQFRTWYDASGGFVPVAVGGWNPLVDDDVHVDRGRLWFEAGLRMEKVPEITIGYSHEWRDGVKDSTSWAAIPNAPLPFPTATAYNIVPSLTHLNELRDTVYLDIAHTIGNTDVELGLRYESVRNDNFREMHREPGEPVAANDRTNIQRDVYEYDLFNAHTSTETRFNDKMLLSLGYAFTTMDTDTDGTERIVRNRTGARLTLPVVDHSFGALTGGGQLFSHVTNANFWWNPIPDLVIVPSIRAEWEDFGAVSMFYEGGAERDKSESNVDNLTEQLEIRYTGINNLLLYARGEFAQSDRELLLMDHAGEFRFSNSDVESNKYTLGANWYPIRGVSIAAQFYRKTWDQDYRHLFSPVVGNSFDGQFLAHEFETDDLSLRVTWRPLPTLTTASRFDFQQTTIENRAMIGSGVNNGKSLQPVDSADIDRTVISQSVTWMPIPQAYVQASISWVAASTETPSDFYAPRRIWDFDNDYITASLQAGCALGRKTEIQAGYLYYFADNYTVPLQPAAAGPPATPMQAGTVPFGSNTEEHVFTVALNRQICPNVIWNIGYGFYTSSDGLFGGYNDYRAHTVSTGVKIRF